MIVLDTDHVSVLQHRDSPGAQAVRERIAGLALDEIATTVVTVEEQMRGWLAMIHRQTDLRRQVLYYDRLTQMIDFFAAWRVLPFDERAADQFKSFREQQIRIGTMDLKIASIAIVRGATLLSRNLSDFRQVPGVRVENWLEG